MNRLILATVTASALAATTLPAVAAPSPASSIAEPAKVGAPLVIERPGVYVLNKSIAAGAGTAVQITASDVTLDLGGNVLFGPGGRRGTGVAVMGASNVRIVNGNLERLGVGVLLDDATNVVVEGLRINGIDSGGTPPDVEIGILLIDTRGARIERNTITNTFLGIFVRGEGSGGNLVADNVITGGDNGELAICYNPAPGEAGGPDGDSVTDNLISRFRRGIALSAGSAGNVIRENTIAYFDVAVEETTAGANLVGDNHAVQIAR
jgi:parallel beta-helix repeat protein